MCNTLVVPVTLTEVSVNSHTHTYTVELSLGSWRLEVQTVRHSFENTLCKVQVLSSKRG